MGTGDGGQPSAKPATGVANGQQAQAGSETNRARSTSAVNGSPPLNFDAAGFQPSSPRAQPGQVLLGTPWDDDARTLRTPPATFSLVSTMVGGGVLSLPYAFSQCGLVLATICLILAAAGSAWTLNMLVDCARSTGVDSFELVAYAAYEKKGQRLTIALVLVLCWLTQVAYFVLLTDLLVPLAELAVPSLSEQPAEMVRHVVVFLAGLLLSPMCFKSSLSAVEKLCFASVGSVLVVAAIVGFRAFENLGHEHTIQVQLSDGRTELLPLQASYQLWPADGMKALYAFPTFGVSFLCHFNALGVHKEIQRPSLYRMNRVIKWTLALATILYFFVGTSGYLYAGCYTCGNILLNFQSKDGLVAIGRGGLGLVIMLNFPLICQPCRNALFRLLTMCCGAQDATAPSPDVESRSTSGEFNELHMTISPESPTGEQLRRVASTASQQQQPGRSAPSAEQLPRVAPAVSQQQKAQKPQQAGSSNSSPLIRSAGCTAAPRGRSPPSSPPPRPAMVYAYRSEDTQGGRGVHPSGASVEPCYDFVPRDVTLQQSASEPTPLKRYVLTALLLSSSLLVSCIMKSIMVVWSVLGSTVCFLIGFILPAMYWSKIKSGPEDSNQRYAAQALALVSSVMGIICSVLAIVNLGEPPCPLHQSSALEWTRSTA
eukprot:TRINITY_DN29586_c0_g1_i1.p1 TRINITY_DN29586_c0_g1~~TRINITY_DN29586_c0_g1_i1.p1  ORF type:complete len:656 (+),score=97.59 TRINITY_DN29586_c0_g1_i1:28-1995(+)